MNPHKWPFQAWLRLAVLHMKLSPDAFWDMPVRDWLWLCQNRDEAPLTAHDFTPLFEAFPDE